MTAKNFAIGIAPAAKKAASTAMPGVARASGPAEAAAGTGFVQAGGVKVRRMEGREGPPLGGFRIGSGSTGRGAGPIRISFQRTWGKWSL